MSVLSSPSHADYVAAPGSLLPLERLANAGGPMSRTRGAHIASTLLGRDDGPIRCPRSLRLGLAFPRAAPIR